MERKIGETFEHKGKKLKVVEDERNVCFDCYFFDGVYCQKTGRERGSCERRERADYKPVIFVEVHEQPQELNLCEILKYCPDGETFWSPMLGDVKFYGIELNRKLVNVILENGETWNINADGTITFGGTTTSPEIMLYPSREQRDWTKVKYEKKKERFDPKTLKPFDKVLSKYDGGCWSANLFSHIEEEDNEYYSTCSFVCNGSLVKFCIPYNDDTKHLVGTKKEAPEYYRYWED